MGIIESSKNIEPAWSALIADLQGYGVSATEVKDNKDFVEGFLAGAKSMTEQSTAAQHQQPSQTPEKKHKIPRKRVTIL